MDLLPLHKFQTSNSTSAVASPMFIFNKVLHFNAKNTIFHYVLPNVCRISGFAKQTMKYLNVAEKNDAAKSISALLSKGAARRTEGLSPYNKLYSFQTNFLGNQVDMVMTSVSGHLMTQDFVDSYRHWQAVDPISLFDAPIVKMCPENFIKIKKTLEREVRGCAGLIIWTDCDREGENIGFEIIDVCRAVKPNIQVYRAKFSEITSAAVFRALNGIAQPDIRQSQAVDVRSELDLRIGAAFTRFQTMRYQRVFPAQIDSLVSYGSCQIPTLGFVARRFDDREKFIPQQFWKLRLQHTINDLTVEFSWDRHRLFDKQCCEAFLMLCQADPPAKVINVVQKPKSKWRPQAMDTIELEKLGSRKLKLSAKETMTIAEKLYSNGIISYPRTETNIFSNEIDLRKLVNNHVDHPAWGSFAQRVLQWSPNPRNGKKSDQAHPPIHPLKFTTDLSGNEQRVYELICRHFLACVSKDATGSETTVDVIVADEKFLATGLCIHERNYLDVYIYEKWNSKEIHQYQMGTQFQPTELSMVEGSTSPPALLTEADLIALMDKHGIGTDATHAEHINTIKTRGYIGEINGGYLVPGTLGMGLVEGYDTVELPLAYPELRAELERDLKLVCSGVKDPKHVLNQQIQKYKEVYKVITEKIEAIDAKLASRFQVQPEAAPQQTYQMVSHDPLFKCPKCKNYEMVLRTKKENKGFFLTCLGKPGCDHVIWLADVIREIKSTTRCTRCSNGSKNVSIRFKSSQYMGLLLFDRINDDGSYTSCLLCDNNLREVLDIRDANSRQPHATGNSFSNVNQPREWARPTNPAPINRNQLSNSNNGPNRAPNFNATNNSFGSNSSRTNTSNTRSSLGGDENVKCPQCNQPATKLTVKKDGPNKGRQFYKCPKQPPCNFFQWADSEPQSFPSGSGQAGGPRQTSTSNTGPTPQAGRARRKCGTCKQEGHTRNKCPRLQGLPNA